MAVSRETLAKAPKVLLHDHLDGGLRAKTVTELASEYGYTKLPTTDVADLQRWFYRGAKRNDLVMYLEVPLRFRKRGDCLRLGFHHGTRMAVLQAVGEDLVLAARLPLALPCLSLNPENLFSKVGQQL